MGKSLGFKVYGLEESGRVERALEPIRGRREDWPGSVIGDVTELFNGTVERWDGEEVGELTRC